MRFCVLILIFCANQLFSQFAPDVDQSVKITAQIDSEANSITLNWILDERVTGFDLYRRINGEDNWGPKIAEFDASVNSYFDEDIVENVLYEYKIQKSTQDNIDGYGYILTGISIAAQHNSGRAMLVATETTYMNLRSDFEKFAYALMLDGWESEFLVVADVLTSAEIRDLLIEEYQQHQFDACILLGDVPISLSGDISPDAHVAQGGAWAADLYYGDMDGVWTDSFVNNTISYWPVNHNIPGDGKWDQSYIPSDIEVAVGRIDFSNLPVFDDSEYLLLSKYLAKNIEFRSKQKVIRRRAAIHNINAWVGALGQSSMRDFSTMVGPDSIMYDNFQDAWEDSYLWLYAASGGSHETIGNITSSEKLATKPLKAVFTGFFGSRFGNYDFENSILRTVLGSGNVLSTCWLGAPSWHHHTMSMGKNLGEATLISQNNLNIYTADSFPRGIHINLLGDPTLKLFPMEQMTDISLSEDVDHIKINWSASDDAEGYHIYRRTLEESYFTLINTDPISETSYRDFCKEKDQTYIYMVRGTKLETTPSGSFYNLSMGVIDTINFTNEYNAIAMFDFDIRNDSVLIENFSINFDSIGVLEPFSIQKIVNNVYYIPNIDSGDTLSLVAYNNCNSDTLSKELIISSVVKHENESLVIFPNPASETLQIKSETTIAKFELFDNTGQVLLTQYPKSKYFKEDISFLNPGIYYLQFTYNRKYIHFRKVFIK